MPTEREGSREAGIGFRLQTLFAAWWQHRAVFFISVAITIGALGVYVFTFVGDRNTPLFDFLKRFEYSTPAHSRCGD